MGLLGKVLMIVENLPVPFDRRVWMEAIALRNAGYQVSVICPAGVGFEKAEETIDGIRIYRHPLPPEVSSSMGYMREYGYALKWEFKLAGKIWKERGGFDIVHICNPPDLLFLIALYFKLFKGCKIIYDQHDLNPELYEAKFGRRDFFYYALRMAERLSFTAANVVISTNQSYREVAVTRGGKKSDRVFVVRSGPDLSKFNVAPVDRGYFKGKSFLVGYVGVMGEQEGIDYLIRAVKYIAEQKKRKDIHFMLIGSGPAEEGMRRLAEELGVAGLIEFTGRVSDEQLVARLSSCDVCVNPDPKTSFNDRSTMNKILEYMALSKAIVQFDLLEGRRSAGDASAYARANDEQDFAEQILRLLDHPQERESMGAIGRMRMREQLEWRHQIPHLLKAYETALNSPSGGIAQKGERSVPHGG